MHARSVVTEAARQGQEHSKIISHGWLAGKRRSARSLKPRSHNLPRPRPPSMFLAFQKPNLCKAPGPGSASACHLLAGQHRMRTGSGPSPDWRHTTILRAQSPHIPHGALRKNTMLPNCSKFRSMIFALHPACQKSGHEHKY